jgi:hypothetical protein
MDRNASLINSFQVLCALEPPTFDRIEQKALAMRLPVHQDVGLSRTSGIFAHSKTWIVTLTSGQHDLGVTEANGPGGHVISCGISAPDADGAAFRKELVSEMKLGQPVNSRGSLRTACNADRLPAIPPLLNRLLQEFQMAGAGGIEPPYDGIKIRCLTAWRRPNVAT